MIEIQSREKSGEDFFPTVEGLAVTPLPVEQQARQWEVAAKKLAEIAVRATSKTSVKKTVIGSLAWPPVE